MLQDAEEETLLVFLATSKEKEGKHEDAAKYFSLAAKASVLAKAVQRNRDLAKVPLFFCSSLSGCLFIHLSVLVSVNIPVHLSKLCGTCMF